MRYSQFLSNPLTVSQVVCWNCPSSSIWMLLPSSCQPDRTLLPIFAMRRDLSGVEHNQLLSCCANLEVPESNCLDPCLPNIPATCCVCQKANWINEWHKTLLYSAEFSAVNTSWFSLKERLKLLLCTWHWNAQTDGATQCLLMRHDFELAWLWLSAASHAISSHCCYQKSRVGECSCNRFQAENILLTSGAR